MWSTVIVDVVVFVAAAVLWLAASLFSIYCCCRLLVSLVHVLNLCVVSCSWPAMNNMWCARWIKYVTPAPPTDSRISAVGRSFFCIVYQKSFFVLISRAVRGDNHC